MADHNHTYEVTLYHSSPWVGASGEDAQPLSDFGMSDEYWDSLTDGEREDHLEEWAKDNFWNSGYEYHGEVTKGE